MNGETIKSFLVGLGFGVDETSLAQFNKAIASATLKVAALYTSIQVASAGIFSGISKISEGFEKIGYEYRIIAPAINKAIQLRTALLAAYQAAGINLKKAAQESVLFNFSLAKTKFALEAIYKSVGLKFIPTLTKQMDIFRKQIYANMPRIQNALEKFVTFVFKAFEATTILGSRVWSILERVYDFFEKLDKATDGWSTVILGVIAAWKLLNLSFIATPFGLLITGLTTLLTLWDDFKTFQEGGQSLINWGSEMTRTVVGMTAAIAGLTAVVIAGATAWNLFSNAGRIYAAVQASINAIMLANPIGLVIAVVAALTAAVTFLDAKWNLFGGHVTGFFSGIGDKIYGFLGANPNVAHNLTNPNNSPTGPLNNPLGTSNVQNSQSTQHINQETNITVQGSPNATATGAAVAGEQGRVNFDLARNSRRTAQ